MYEKIGIKSETEELIKQTEKRPNLKQLKKVIMLKLMVIWLM